MMYAVLISVIFCSSVAEVWPGSNWRFWSNPSLIVPNAPVITGTIFFSPLCTSGWPQYPSLCPGLVFHVLLCERLNHVVLSISREVFNCRVLRCTRRVRPISQSISVNKAPYRILCFQKCRAVLTHGPKGPGPRAANFQGRHIKKIEIEVWNGGKKKAVHEREI
jgi:hypothetical protein